MQLLKLNKQKSIIKNFNMFEAPRENYQVRKGIQAEENPEETKIQMGQQCLICNQHFPEEEMKSICPCDHRFCQDCLKYYSIYKIKNQFSLIQCPREGCPQILNTQSQMFLSLAEDLRKRYFRIKANIKALKGHVEKMCPDCSSEMRAIQGEHNLFCEKCVMKFCSKCLGRAHPKHYSCQRYIIQFLKRNYQFKRCAKCLFIIEKKQGCIHMTCVCGYQFCYLCGGDWQHGNHVCPPKPKYIKPIAYRVVKKEHPIRETLKPNILNLGFIDESNTKSIKYHKPCLHGRISKKISNENRSILQTQRTQQQISSNQNKSLRSSKTMKNNSII